MSFKTEVVKALEPDEAIWITARCICGKVFRVPSSLSSREGTCPQCHRSFITHGKPAVSLRAESVFLSNHPEREFKRVAQEPNFAHPESGFAIAARHTAIPGTLFMLASLCVCQAMIEDSPRAMATLGMRNAPPWLLPAWLLAVFMNILICVGTSVLVFQHISRKSYTKDTVAFAAAGGYDIARWIPLLCYILLYGAYASSLNRSWDAYLAVIRSPWLFLAVGAALSHLATWLVAWWVFNARFERSR